MSTDNPTFAALLAHLRQEANLSYRELGRHANVSAQYVHRLATGQDVSPTPAVAAALDAAVRAGGRLAALAALRPTSPADAARLAALSGRPDKVDREAVNTASRVLADLRREDDAAGSVAMLPLVTAHMRTISGAVLTVAGPVRDRLLPVAAGWAQFAGWVHLNAQRWTQARMYLGTALQWAIEADDLDMIATVLSYQAHMHWLRGDPVPVVGLSRRARRDPEVYPGQSAYDAYQEARALAALGDDRAAVETLIEANDLAERAVAWTGERPAHQYYRDPWFFALEQGLVYLYLSRPADAAVLLAQGLGDMPDGWADADWAAEYTAYLARAYRESGESTLANQAAARARQVAERTQSRRVLKLVDDAVAKP